MANEIAHNHTLNKTVYAIRFQPDGDVFITSGASDETWGAGGNNALHYAVLMAESTLDSSGHYVGSFDGSSNIGAGVYPVTIYEAPSGVPTDADPQIGQGEIYWDGTAEINPSTLGADIATAQADLDIITGTAGVLIDDGAISEDTYDETTAFPIASEDAGATQIARTGADSDTLETLSDGQDDLSAEHDQIIQNQQIVLNRYPTET